MLELILIIVLVLLLNGSMPRYGYGRDWSYYPSGAIGLSLLIVIIVLLLGRL